MPDRDRWSLAEVDPYRALQCILNCKAMYIENFTIVFFQLSVNNTSAVKLPPSEQHFCHSIWRIWMLPLQIITDPIRDKVLNIHEYQRLIWLSRKLKSTFCSRKRENSPKEEYIYLEIFFGAFCYLNLREYFKSYVKINHAPFLNISWEIEQESFTKSQNWWAGSPGCQIRLST